MTESTKIRILKQLVPITKRQLKSAITNNNEGTQIGLSDVLMINAGTISRHLEDMKRQGLIQYEKCNIPGRPRKVKVFYLTARGQKKLQELNRKNSKSR